MPEDQLKTFFSYARRDSVFVLRLVKDLRAAGATVWLDQLDIRPGQHWDTEIGRALQSCFRNVIVLSPDSVDSANVLDEITYALDRKKQVIPLLYLDCEIPYRLSRLQYIDFRHDYPTGLADLLNVLGTIAPTMSGRIVSDPTNMEQRDSGLRATQGVRTVEPWPPEPAVVKAQTEQEIHQQDSGRLAPRMAKMAAAKGPREQSTPQEKGWLLVFGIVLFIVFLLLIVAGSH